MYIKIIHFYHHFMSLLKRFLNYLVDISDKEWHRDIYKYSSYLSILLILVTYSGVIYINPEYTLILHNFLIIYVCIILLIRFNPLVKRNNVASYVLFNKNIAFTAGIILLTTTVAKNLSDLYLPVKIYKDIEEI